MARIAVDMDEVLADAHTAQLQWLEANFGDASLIERGREGALCELLRPDMHTALQNHLHEGSFFGDLRPMPGAQDVLARLNTRHELFVTTAAFEYPASLSHKYDWLRRHFPFLDPLRFVFCGDKSIISADFLVDDNSRHFTRFRGQGVLFDAPHNRAVGGYPRVRNWIEAEAFLSESSQ